MDRIKLKSIYASEHLTSSGGEVVPVSRLHPDPEEAAKIAAGLVAGGYADAVGTSTAAAPAVLVGGVAVAIPAVAALTLEEALNALNPDDPEDWTAAGLPSMFTLSRLMGNHEITRADVVAAFPDFMHPQAKAVRNIREGRRPEDSGTAGTAENGDTSGGDAGKSDEGGDAGKSDEGGDAGKSDEGGDAGKTDEGGDAGKTDEGGDAGKTDEGGDAGKTDEGGDAGDGDDGDGEWDQSEATAPPKATRRGPRSNKP